MTPYICYHHVTPSVSLPLSTVYVIVCCRWWNIDHGALDHQDKIHYYHHHQSLNREGRWGTADNYATSFLHFPLFSTALSDLPNSRPVHFLMLSSHLFLCLPCLLPPFTVPCKMVLARPDERETWPYPCSLRLFTMSRIQACMFKPFRGVARVFSSLWCKHMLRLSSVCLACLQNKFSWLHVYHKLAV